MNLKGAWLINSYKLCSRNISDTKGSHLRVNIPYYQRPYKWGDEHIKRLIDDFFEHINSKVATKQNDENYFTGSIVTVDKEDDEYHDIIDGQQRITTVFLLSYLKFLLLRSLIDESISRSLLVTLIDNAKSMKNCYFYMIGKGNTCDFEKLTTYIESNTKEIEKERNSYEKEKKMKTFLECYRDKIQLPKVEKSNEELYKDEYKKGLERLFDDEQLALRYSRESLNDKLKTALKNIFVEVSIDRGLNVSQLETDKDPIVDQYTAGIISIYNSIVGLLSPCSLNGDTIDKATLVLENIDKFTESMQFCLIRTGNENDAYTLFEVLNDRALEVDDLDLIKNLFYRKYCLSPISPNDTITIDRQIEELENIWGEEVFTRELGDKQTKLIAYLSFIFLTGNENIDYTDKQRYRNIAEDYLNNKVDLSFSSISDDFKIFQSIRIMQQVFDLQFRNTKNKSLEVEMNRNVSITYKAIHLINALGYKGVMPVIANIILRSYYDELKSKSKTSIDTNEFTKFVEEIKSDKDHIDNRFSEIHSCAQNVWKLSLLANDYRIPRDYTKLIVKRVNYRNSDKQIIKIDSNTLDTAIEQFKEWTDAWGYKANKNNDFKIKILLLKLVQAELDDGNNNLCYRYSQPAFDTDKIQLDHLEANIIDNNNIANYFKPKDPKVDRSKYVNSLGNFMIMNDKNNIRKGNSPAYKVPEHYKAMGLGDHWLIKEFEELMKLYGTKNCSGNYLPTENFFDTRKENLQRYFLSILKNKTINSNEIDIINSI